MTVYRIARTEKRCRDISGMGAYKEGGRWNSPGTYMLYTSENSSLAFLENLVHFEADNLPPELFIMKIELQMNDSLIYTLPEEDYPKDWTLMDNLENQNLGDRLMAEQKYAAIKLRSAVNRYEYNVLLNPLFPGYHDLANIVLVEELSIDTRLLK